jgi:hypothetical protein
MQRAFATLAAGLLLLAAVTGCQSAYYSAWEKLGYHKRDILKERVVEARDEQQAAGEQFKDALTRLKEISGYQGGELEAKYNRLKASYDDAASRAAAVRSRIRGVEDVAGALFAEWEKEIAQIGTPALAADSRTKLSQTRARYGQMHAALVKAEGAMDPVLRQLNDYVLYLKHNLNAQAIASLGGTSATIQTDISNLIGQMNQSIAEADAFVKTLQGA